MSVILRLLLPLPIIGLGIFAAMHFIKKPAEEEDSRPQRRTRPAQRAEATPLERIDYQIVIQTRGVVQPNVESDLTSRIGGRVESLHENFQVGSFFKKGDILVTLDPTDAETAIIGAEAEVARALAALAQEEARAKQAELNWRDLGYEEKPNELVLRKPQMREANANLKTAQARLAEAKRNRYYSKIIAPFDGCVRELLIGPGQSVGPNSSLGTIFGTNFAEVRLPVSPKDLPFTPFQSQNALAETPAVIRDGLTDSATNEDATWDAQLIRSEGVIDETSRELFLIARIPDPYGLESKRPPLRVGQPVVAEIQGNLLEEVFVVPRKTLRNTFEILLVNNEDSTLLRQDIAPFWTDRDNLIVSHELPENHSLITTRIASASNGALIELIGSPADSGEPVEAAQTSGKNLTGA